jgi:hypothetical protein
MARGLIIAVSETMIKGGAMTCMNQTGLNGKPDFTGKSFWYRGVHKNSCLAIFGAWQLARKQRNEPSFNAIHILWEVVNTFICLTGGKHCTAHLIVDDFLYVLLWNCSLKHVTE